MKVTVSREVKQASAEYVWKKLAAYSDLSWHPNVEECRNIGDIADGSPNMVGARRCMKTSSAEAELSVVEWSYENMHYRVKLDKGSKPPFAESVHLEFQVRTDKATGKVYVEEIVDIGMKPFTCFLIPVAKKVVAAVASGFITPFSEVVEE